MRSVRLPKIQIENYNQSKGSFDVILKDVTSKSGVSTVQISVWSKVNQSDIVWYQADRQSDRNLEKRW